MEKSQTNTSNVIREAIDFIAHKPVRFAMLYVGAAEFYYPQLLDAKEEILRSNRLLDLDLELYTTQFKIKKLPTATKIKLIGFKAAAAICDFTLLSAASLAFYSLPQNAHVQICSETALLVSGALFAGRRLFSSYKMNAMHQPKVRKFGLEATSVMVVLANLSGLAMTNTWHPIVKNQIANACPKLGEGVLTQDDEGLKKITKYTVTKITKDLGSVSEILGKNGKSIVSVDNPTMETIEYSLSYNRPSFWNRYKRIDEVVTGLTTDTFPVCTPK